MRKALYALVGAATVYFAARAWFWLGEILCLLTGHRLHDPTIPDATNHAFVPFLAIAVGVGVVWGSYLLGHAARGLVALGKFILDSIQD